MPLLPFISDGDLLREVKKVLDVAESATNSPEEVLYSNVVDPFSALFDTFRQKMPLTEWLHKEKDRQIQKTVQNALGTFHQSILGNVKGWNDLRVGGIIDVANDKTKIIAEIKNKHNTTKGNHKKEIYEDLASVLGTTYNGYTGYYVEIIPASKKPYNKPFTPPDNLTHTIKPSRDDIRVIDGKSFYALATGYDDAIDLLYEALPIALARLSGANSSLAKDDLAFKELFHRAYL